MPGEVYLWGSGGGACEIQHVLDDLHKTGVHFAVRAVVGRGPRSDSKGFENVTYIDTNETGWQSGIDAGCGAIITAGTPHLRELMRSETDGLGLERPAIVHPSAVVASTACLGPGCVVGPNATISAYASLGDNVYVSFNSSIGHHTSVGQDGVISPGARIGGEVICGPRFFIGLGGVVVPRVKIGSGVSVSAGGLVAGHLADGSRVIQQKSRVIGGL